MEVPARGFASGTADDSDRGDANRNDFGNGETVAGGGPLQIRIREELPFLVTHWLANYNLEREAVGSGSNDNDNDDDNNNNNNNDDNNDNNDDEAKRRERAAMARIRRATSELASAFASIGAYGTTFRSSLESSSSFLNRPVLQNRTFGDMNRLHAGLAPSHLEHLAQSVAFNAATADSVATEEAHTNFLLRANSPGEPASITGRHSTGEGSAASVGQGRSLQDAIDVDGGNGNGNSNYGDGDGDGDGVTAKNNNSMGGWGNQGVSSILQRPTLIASARQRNQSAAVGRIDSDPVDGGSSSGGGNERKENNNTEPGSNAALVRAERDRDETPYIDVRATHWEVAHQTAETVRRFLTLREQLRSIESEIRSLEASLSLHQNTVQKLNGLMSKTEGDATLTAVEKLERIEKCKSSQQTSDRVIIQLVRKLSELGQRQKSLASEVARLQSEARSLEERRRTTQRAFRDPFAAWKGSLSKGSRVGGCFALQTVVGRQQGWSMGRLSTHPNRYSLTKGPNPAHFLESRKNLLTTRLSHAITMNAHMNCPVYCLRFDRTGRYFVTGADDFLLKVFYVGAAQSCRRRSGKNNKHRRLRCNYGANFRGAVLVCTLRGHAGVINDIDVSMDNCLLATASVDGDVRVWGLKNGCPVAILRGHKGGANMVSWSTLTPYRLVSTGSDGFARVWDIREACLKRYGNVVNHRAEYNLRLTPEEIKFQNERRKKGKHGAKERATVPNLLPPLPSRNQSSQPVVPTVASNAVISAERSATSAAAAPSQQASSLDGGSGSGSGSGNGSSRNNNNNSSNNNNDHNRSNNNEFNDNGIIVPPLPAAVPPLGQGADGGNQNGGGRDENAVDGAAPGDFVANDLIDEGVKLLSKYQHGTIQEEHGPGTRSRRSAVNVICVSRCPLGNQFVTGSDDGIIRVWEDFDDSSVAIVDARLSGTRLENLLPATRESVLGGGGDKNEPLLKLMGHVSTVTDLAYSHAGDRILSASQKDGVVRVWNIGIATAKGKCGKMEFKDKRVTQIVINLVNPFSNKSSQPIRRRPGSAARNAGSKVCCDVAVWTHDDSSIVTSQCVPVKENSTDIQPGSHFICMWDSKSGRCLISISGAHTSQCQVVIPHPTDASILCTASTDGFVKLWDWNKGKCIFSHRNKVDFGPTDPNSPNKIGGYLDGSFSADGTFLVLTDDDGFITVLDSISEDDDPPNTGKSLAWMREQYFANDYYDLVYDRNGYCIERGSEQPPHLAPKGARCTHNGAPYSEDVNESFERLLGPTPLPENSCSWRREQMRARRFSHKHTIRSSGREPTVRVSVREFDPSSTVIIRGVDHRGGDHLGNSKSRTAGTSAFGSSSQQGGTRSQSSAPARTMSANYRYLDYDDLIRREGNPEEAEPDSDDEEFQPAAARTQMNANNDEVESEDDDLDDLDIVDEGSNRRRGSGQRNQSSTSTSRSTRPTEERRARAQRRAQRHDTDFMEIDSDDEMIAQFVSANRTPSGPYLRDYTINGHYWRLKSQADAVRVRRKWLHREESDSSYFGRNPYTPQMGDSIVYIPRAHFETIKQCPSLSPPWQSWPTSAVWPVVRCFVRGIRYRFPYEDYFRTKQHAKCSSIVAILTLEVTGIPEISEDRDFPWPKPSFIEPTRPFIFELSVFESSSCEYIVPETLYTSRITALENHIRSRSNGAVGLEVDLYYEQEQEDSDLQAWPATVENILPDEGHSDVHLQGSGFGVVQVWDGSEQNRDFVSPWELNTDGVNLTRPCMSEDEKKCVLKELNHLLRKEEIANHLSMPVDQQRYCDYAMMIEIPMDLMLVKGRLAANFYGSKLAVASDLRLIRDNCIKYNTDENMMSAIASNMCNDFEQRALSTDERSQMISEAEFDKIHKEQSEGRQVSSLRIRISARTVQEANEAAGSNGGRYTLRDRTANQGQSSLESLPAPANGSSQSRRNRSEVDANNAQRNRARIEDTEVLGQMGRLRPGRRGAPSIDTGPNNSSGRRTRAQSNGSNFSSVQSSRTLRGGTIPENGGLGDRRSHRTRNSEDQNILNPGMAPSHNEHSNDAIDREEIDASRSQSVNNRRGLGSARSPAPELQQDADMDVNLGAAPPPRSSTRAGGRTTRRSGRARSPYFEEENQDESDGEESEEQDPSNESDPERKHSDAESHYSDEGNEIASSGDELSVEPSPPAQRSRRSTRSTRNSAPLAAPAVHSPERRSGRASARSVRNNARVVLPAEHSPSRRSSRNAAKQRKIYEEIDSDADDYGSEEEDSDNSDADVNTARSSRRGGRSTASAPRYKGSDSESEEVEEESEEEEPSPPPARRSSASSKRKGPASGRAPAAKRPKANPNDFPEISKWPEIGVANITRVTRKILNRISEDDCLELFSRPVVEAYPSIAGAYLSIIEKPMDLRTIEEERVHVYRSIKMLQEDLILMFQNCCTYNGRQSEYGAMAVSHVEALNQIFIEVCQELKILLPRRWKP